MVQHRRREFGDFQTPIELAREVCSLLAQKGARPRSIVEPTCGCGAFLIAALESFRNAEHLFGVDINADYVRHSLNTLNPVGGKLSMRVLHADFFKLDWRRELSELPDPLLIIGNPPWVTNSTLSAINGTNLPRKSNFQNHRGIEAITGKSNFDIAEWILLQLIDCLSGRQATLAMLCKTATARKVLKWSWKNGYRIAAAATYAIDAKTHFGANVDGCLLVVDFAASAGPMECYVHDSLEQTTACSVFGLRDGNLVANLEAYDRWRHLFALTGKCKWRSGVKHDCAAVMELLREGDGFRNGLREFVNLEERCLYPMYKGSEISKPHIQSPTRWMVVPQRNVAEDTLALTEIAPGTWNYLVAHRDLLDRRSSSIYKKRAPFSIFGVGDYTFSEWKVAVSALYKEPRFPAIGTYRGKPIVLDDTCYFLACESQSQAEAVSALLNSPNVKDALSAFIFWDSKRPITTDVLNRLDLPAIAEEAGLASVDISKMYSSQPPDLQATLF